MFQTKCPFCKGKKTVPKKGNSYHLSSFFSNVPIKFGSEDKDLCPKCNGLGKIDGYKKKIRREVRF